MRNASRAIIALLFLFFSFEFSTSVKARDEPVAAPYEMLGIKRWSMMGKTYVSVHIRANTQDPHRSLFSAIRVADRLASDQRVDFVRVFTQTTGTEWTKVGRVEHAVSPSEIPAMKGQTWNLLVFWQNERERVEFVLTDPDDIAQPPGFTDALTIYQRECPSTGTCAFGIQGW